MGYPHSHMPHADEASYLELMAGPYALGLPARCVVQVLQDVVHAGVLRVKGGEVPLVDLRAALGMPARSELPFVVALEAGGALAAVGVDRVEHLRRQEAPLL